MTVRTVAVVHRLAMVAEGIAAALARYMWIAPVVVATTAFEAEDLDADAVALDPELPGATELARRLTRRGTRVVFLGDVEADERVSVPLDAPVSLLAARLAPGSQEPDATVSLLTPREREVLELVARGLAGKQVARRLGISPKTVEMHKSRIYSKLRVPNQAAAVRIAVTRGLGDPRREAAVGPG